MFLALFSLALYIDALSYDFVWDDDVLIVNNQYTKYPRYIPTFFTRDFSQLTFNEIGGQFYRPVLALSFLFDYQLWGLNPAGYHLTNVLLHVVNTLLVYRVGLLLFSSGGIALLAVFLFAAHPVHVEVAAFISGRVDSLLTLFFLLSFLSFVRFRRGAPSSGFYHYGTSLFFFGMALLSKETAVVLPLILMAYDYTLRSNLQGSRSWGDFWQKVRPYVPFLLILAGYLLLRSGAIQIYLDRGFTLAEVPQRFLIVSGAMARYVVLSFLPFSLNPLYDLPSPQPFEPMTMASLLLWPLIALGIALAGRDSKGILFASLWFFSTLLPVSNLIPFRPPRGALLMAERYLYLPSIGICWFLALALEKVRGVDPDGSLRLPRRLAPLLAAGLVVLFSLITLRQNGVWKDERSLYAKMVEKNPDSADAHVNLGNALLAEKRYEEALGFLRKAVQLNQNDSTALLSLVDLYRELGWYGEAGEALQRARQIDPNSPRLFLHAAAVSVSQGMIDEGIATLQQAVRLYPDLAMAHQGLGVAFRLKEDSKRALFHFKKAIEISPDLFWSHYGLGALSAKMGKSEEAIMELRTSLTLKPDFLPAMREMALLLERMDRGEEAILLWRRILEEAPEPAVVREAVDRLRALGSPYKAGEGR